MNSKIDEILEKFTALSNEEKIISSDLEAAFKDYNDYLNGSDEDLSRKIREIRDKMSKLDYYIDYAKTHAHADGLEEATTPFETSDGQFESIRQTIKLDSHNDPNAESLYTKATGQKLFYEKKIEETKKLIENSKIQARRQYENSATVLNERKRQLDREVMSYVQSDNFREYLRLLSFDKSAFNSTGTAQLPDNSAISLGQRRVKLIIPQEVEQDITLASNGEYNAASHTIGAPFKISMKKGCVMYLDYDDRNKQYLLGGIQRLLLNSLKYCSDNIRDIFFCEPNTNSPELLGTMASLGKGVNPFITVPVSADDIDGKIAEYTSRIEMSPTPDKVSRIMVLNNFSEKYSDNTRARILYLCKNAERYGVLIMLTHNNSREDTDYEREIRSMAVSVRSVNGGFYVEKLRESLFWYSAPSELPDDIRRVYVEQRRAKATQNGTAMRMGEPAPRQTPNTPLYQMPGQAAEPNLSGQTQYPAAPGMQNPAASFPQQTVPPYGMSNPAAAQYIPPYGMSNPVPPFGVQEPTQAQPFTMSDYPQGQQFGVNEPASAAPAYNSSFGAAKPDVPVNAPETAEPVPANDVSITRSEDGARDAAADTEASESAARESGEPDAAADETSEAHGEIAAETEEEPAEEESDGESVIRKGSRRLSAVTLGVSKSGKRVKLDIGKGVTCVVGDVGDERRSCVDKIINSVMNSSHPDDAELWMFDFSGDLMNRAERAPAHIKYLVADNSADFSEDIVDVLSAEYAARVRTLMESGLKRCEEVPADKYMPRIVVIINGFDDMYDNISRSTKLFGKDSLHILTKLFRKCACVGIHFILISSAFTSGGELFGCLKDGAVGSAVAADGRISEIRAVVEAAGADNFTMPKRIPEGRVLKADESGVAPVKLSEVETLAPTGYIPVFEYSDEQEEYVAKNALITNRLSHVAFEDRNEALKSLIGDRADGEKLIFAGEPSRLTRSYPISLCEDFGENVFAFVSDHDKQNSASVVGAAIMSLLEQNVSIELLSTRSDPVYAELLRAGILQGVNVFEGDQVIVHVKELASGLNSAIHANKVVIVLGGDVLLSAMNAADLMTELKKLLVKGPYKGVHMIFVTTGASQIAPKFISLFRHKIVFPCPMAEAEKLLRDSHRELPETGFRYSDDYDELTMKPFLL